MDLSNLLNGVSAQEDQQEKTALPAGKYNCVIEKVEAKTNAQSGNKGVNVTLRVFGAKFNNYCVFDYMAITHATSPKVLEYSLPKLKKLGLLCASEDTAQWVGKKVAVNLSVDKNDNTKNINWGYSEATEEDNTASLSGASTNVNVDTSDLPF